MVLMVCMSSDDVLYFYEVSWKNTFSQEITIVEFQRGITQTRKMPNGIMDVFFKKSMKRVVFLACDTPTGPPLHPYQIWKESTEEKR